MKTEHSKTMDRLGKALEDYVKMNQSLGATYSEAQEQAFHFCKGYLEQPDFTNIDPHQRGIK